MCKIVFYVAKSIMAMLSFLLLLGQTSLSGQSRQDTAYYHFGDKQIALSPQPDEWFVVFSVQITESVAREFVRSAFPILQPLQSGDIHAPLQSLRLRLQPNVAAGAADSLFSALRNLPAVAQISPAYRSHEGKLYVTNRLLVGIRGKASAALFNLVQQQGCEMVQELSQGQDLVWILKANKGVSVFKAAHTLFESGKVLYAEPEFVYDIFQNYIPNDFSFGSQWFLDNWNDADIDAPEAWNLTTGASSTVVAVIDGHGYELTHPDMAGKFISPYDAVNNDAFPDPENVDANHGMPCSGLIGAATNNGSGVAGVGFNVMVKPVMIGYNANNQGGYTSSTIIFASAASSVINTAGVAAVSNSYTTGMGTFTSYQTSVENIRTQCRGGLGAVFLAGTANAGLLNDVQYPCYLPRVIGVGASNSSDTRAYFSNYGDSTDVVAPGENCYTIDRMGGNGYDGSDFCSFSGTSAACPVAAGVVGLMASINPSLTGDQLAAKLQQSCDKVGGYPYASAWGYSYGMRCQDMGYGRVNAYQAVLLAQGTGNIGMIDEFNGTSLGATSGITYPMMDCGQQVAQFSLAAESRIQYPFGNFMPTEGTLEWELLITNGYSYSNYFLNNYLQNALIFTTDVAGGDVTWPGSTWLSVSNNGDISLTMATAKYGISPAHQIVATGTAFRFGQWHRIGISFGAQGQYLMLDGVVVASNWMNTQTLGAGGNHNSPVDIPTIGESVSGFWSNNQYDGGFEGFVNRFRISPNQQDWNIASGPSSFGSAPQYQPTVAASAYSFCTGQQVQLYVTNPEPGVSYTWSTGASGTSIWVSTTGNYYVTASNACGAITSFACYVFEIAYPDKPIVTVAGNTLTTQYCGCGYRWYLNSTIIPSATMMNPFIATQSGWYEVETYNSGSNCSVFSDPVYVQITEIETPINTDVAWLYPNPTHNKQVTVDLRYAATLELYDILGRQAANIALAKGFHPIDFQSLPDGVYTVVLRQNDQTVSQKLVLQP